MDKRTKHIGKSEKDKGIYVGRLAKTSYSSTAEVEQLPLPESDVSEEEPRSVSVGTRRPIGFGESLKGHFGQNWVYYVMTLVIGLVIGLIVFLFGISGSLGRVEGMLDGIRNTLNKHEEKIDNIEEKIQEQNLKIQEQSIKMDYLEKRLPSK